MNRLVMMGDKPAEVPGEVIEALRLRCDPEGHLTEALTVAPGDRIQLLNGPFADFIGTVEKIAPDRRVWVLIELLGRPTRVSIDDGRWQIV